MRSEFISEKLGMDVYQIVQEKNIVKCWPVHIMQQKIEIKPKLKQHII